MGREPVELEKMAYPAPDPWCVRAHVSVNSKPIKFISNRLLSLPFLHFQGCLLEYYKRWNESGKPGARGIIFSVRVTFSHKAFGGAYV
jgi:hypothetical protein